MFHLKLKDQVIESKDRIFLLKNYKTEGSDNGGSQGGGCHGRGGGGDGDGHGGCGCHKGKCDNGKLVSNIKIEQLTQLCLNLDVLVKFIVSLGSN